MVDLSWVSPFLLFLVRLSTMHVSLLCGFNSFNCMTNKYAFRFSVKYITHDFSGGKAYY